MKICRLKKNGSLFIEDDRSILISISAFGTLRRNLIENIGLERMKGFLIRYGWELGQEDARKAKKKDFTTIKEAVDFGPIIHRMRGHAEIGITKLETEQQDGNYLSFSKARGKTPMRLRSILESLDFPIPLSVILCSDMLAAIFQMFVIRR